MTVRRKKLDTWMAFYVGDYLADTMHLTTEQHGAYILLIFACWKGGGTIPSDDESLMAIARLLPDAWHASRIKLLAFFKEAEPGLLTHSRVAHEIARAKETSAARSASGKKGAKAKWQNSGKEMTNAMAKPVATAQQNDAPSPSPSLNTNTAAPEGTARPTKQAKEIVFSKGIDFLMSTGVKEQSARTFLGLQCKRSGDEAVCRALMECERLGVVEPRGWITNYLANVGRSATALAQTDFSETAYGEECDL